MPGVPLTTEQRVFIVKTYFETKSLSEVNVKKYTHHGTSLNRQEKNSGRKRTGGSPENIDAVQIALPEQPKWPELSSKYIGIAFSNI